jgi:hypothetical protein
MTATLSNALLLQQTFSGQVIIALPLQHRET